MDTYRPPDDLDFDNPYAPPKSSTAPEATPQVSHFAGIPFSIDSIINASWSIYKQNLGPCLWVVWIVMLINFGLGFVLGMLLAGLNNAMGGDPQSFNFVNFAVNFLSTIFQVWTGIGMNRALIKIVRRRADFNERAVRRRALPGAHDSGRDPRRLPVLRGDHRTRSRHDCDRGGASESIGRGGLVFLAFGALLVVLIAYLSARLLMFYFLVIDRNAGVTESIGLAWQITHGRAGTIIVVYFLQLALILAGVLALCVGLVFTVPLSNLLWVVTYLAAVGTVKSPERMPLMRWEEDL